MERRYSKPEKTEAELAAELDEIFRAVGEPLDTTTAGLAAELSNRCVWLARSGQIMADAQYYHDVNRGRMQQELIQAHPEAGATLLRELVTKSVAPYTRLLIQSEKLNSTIRHQIDAIRSLLSFEKEQAKGGL